MINHVVMHLDSIRDVGSENHKELTEEWGPTITIVDFVYDSTGKLKSVMAIVRTGLTHIDIDPRWSLDAIRPPCLDDVLMYYTPDRETFPQCTATLF